MPQLLLDIVIKYYQYFIFNNMTSPPFKNPKRRKHSEALAPVISGHNYYAAYSSPFVHSVFDHLNLPHDATVLDPWNGSGTTTRVARWRKIDSIGFDLNPATLVIAKAGLIDWNTLDKSVQPLSKHLLEQTQKNISQKRLLPRGDCEPFNQWFTSATSGVLRSLELTIRSTLVGLSAAQPTQFSPLAAFFYLALFRTVRDLAKTFCGSNPTWIKTAKDSGDRVKFCDDDIYKTFEAAIKELSTAFAEWEKQQAIHRVRGLRTDSFSQVRLDIADSRRLPIADRSVDAVITSPPYCTRIDYVVAMLPELAVIGIPLSETDALKRRLLGTNTVPTHFPIHKAEWGESSRHLLHSIENHSSRASNTYYLKWAAQYIDSLYDSLSEINRVLKRESRCAIVVQDSYYKEIKIDLPLIVREMTSAMKWRFEGKTSYQEKQTMAAVNPRIKVYREHSNAEECVLVFKTNL